MARQPLAPRPTCATCGAVEQPDSPTFFAHSEMDLMGRSRWTHECWHCGTAPRPAPAASTPEEPQRDAREERGERLAQVPGAVVPHLKACNEWNVMGSKGTTYTVRFGHRRAWTCDCPDARAHTCKHVHAVRYSLLSADGQRLTALGALLAAWDVAMGKAYTIYPYEDYAILEPVTARHARRYVVAGEEGALYVAQGQQRLGEVNEERTALLIETIRRLCVAVPQPAPVVPVGRSLNQRFVGAVAVNL